MALSVLAVDQAASALLNCVCTSLDQLPTDVAGLHGCPCRRGVIAGLAAADGCDGGCTAPGPGEWPGQLTVNVVRIYASDRQSFPRESTDVRNARSCPPPPVTAVEMLVTVFRCAPGPTDRGCPPSMADLATSATQVHADMMAVQRGILCCLADTDPSRLRGRRFVLGASRTLGPQGGCVGIEQRVTVALDDFLCCPENAPETP